VPYVCCFTFAIRGEKKALSLLSTQPLADVIYPVGLYGGGGFSEYATVMNFSHCFPDIVDQMVLDICK